jgi:hypothetical protein
MPAHAFALSSTSFPDGERVVLVRKASTRSKHLATLGHAIEGVTVHLPCSYCCMCSRQKMAHGCRLRRRSKVRPLSREQHQKTMLDHGSAPGPSPKLAVFLAADGSWDSPARNRTTSAGLDATSSELAGLPGRPNVPPSSGFKVN